MRFDSISAQTMEKSLDALWLKTKVITNNISNYETPGYKAKDVTFEQVMSEESAGGKRKLLMRTRVTENPNTTVRPDGNNVNMDREQLELWRTQAQYANLVQKINGSYTNLRYVIKSALK